MKQLEMNSNYFKFVTDMENAIGKFLLRPDSEEVIIELYHRLADKDNILPLFVELIKEDKTRHKTFHKNLKKIRTECGLTQKELLEEVSVLVGREYSPAYISSLEVGRRLPSEEVLTAISTALNCDKADLFRS